MFSRRKVIEKKLEEVAEIIAKDRYIAMKFLRSAGIIDKNGQLTKQYRQEEPIDEDLEIILKLT